MSKHQPSFIKRYFQSEGELFILELELNPESTAFEILKTFLNKKENLDELNARASQGMLLSEHVSAVALRTSNALFPNSVREWELDIRNALGTIECIDAISETWFRFVFKPLKSIKKSMPAVFDEFSLCVRYSKLTVDNIESVFRIITFDVCAQALTA